MLKTITFEDVGPFRQATLDFAPRVNLVVGDTYGTAKTLLTDTVWWALTGSWAKEEGCGVFVGDKSRICVSGGGGELEGRWHLNCFWKRSGEIPTSGTVFYACSDGEYFRFPGGKWNVSGKHSRYGALIVGTRLYEPAVSLIDEPELHLHPEIQRAVVPDLLRAFAEKGQKDFQIIVSTYSPLVLASMEPFFDKEKDALHILSRDEKGTINISRSEWRPRGDVSSWLTSEVFGLKQARSLPAEQAIERALQVMRTSNVSPEELQEIHNELYRLLKDSDPFWVRWLYRAERKGLEV